MAQDFGDDMGNALLNFVTRQAENYLRFGRGRERAFDWWQRHYKKEGNTPEAAKAMAEKQSSREQAVVPFGTSEEAAYYAQVCRENGTYAAAYTDKQGNGFLAFAKEDAKTVAGYAPQFKDVMARLDEQRITDALNHAKPVNKKTMDSLTELTSYPDLPAEDVTVIPVTIRYKDAPEETYDVLFSEQATENLNIDDSICFSGYSHKELTEMVGRETHEDFDVIAVSDPYKVHATQAHASDPDYYLHHDIYRNYNPLGALYLDAECEKEGFQSPNAVILGHSLTLGNAVTCFGNIQRYSGKSFASEHQTVLIQTPNTKMRYTVRFANIVKGWEPTKRTVFAGDSDFRNWYDSSRESAAMVLDTDSEPNQVISLVSCSYNFWKQNERTVVTTSIDQKQAQTETVSTESRQTGSGAE